MKKMNSLTDRFGESVFGIAGLLSAVHHTQFKDQYVSKLGAYADQAKRSIETFKENANDSNKSFEEYIAKNGLEDYVERAKKTIAHNKEIKSGGFLDKLPLLNEYNDAHIAQQVKNDYGLLSYGPKANAENFCVGLTIVGASLIAYQAFKRIAAGVGNMISEYKKGDSK